MRPLLPPLVLLLLGAGSLGGCARLDTYNRPYTWHPSGANAANLAAMVAHPADLQLGHGSYGSDAAPQVAAISAVEQGQAVSLGGATSGGKN